MYSTYQYRIKDATSAKKLAKMAGSVNFVWNYCNETSDHAIGRNREFLTGFDLSYLTAGASKLLKLPAASIQEVCCEYATRRKQFKKRKLTWRSSKRSKGWVPFKAASIKIKGNCVRFNGIALRFWNSRVLPEDALVKSGSFNQDARGRWYVNIAVSIPDTKNSPTEGESVGIDLGLKTLATLSDGTKIEAPKFFRKSEEKLAKAQRANKKKLARTIHAKIAHQRKDFAHKESTKIANSYKEIFVGNVSSKKLAKTKMAKSVNDAGWAFFKTLLGYKALRLGKVFAEINEAFSSVTCSSCFVRSGPSGLSNLGVREWVCGTCGSIHDRDTNAALNILRLGHQTLTKGIPHLKPQA